MVKNNFRILLYHSIGGEDAGDRLNIRLNPSLFNKHMEHLAKEDYHILPLGEIIKTIFEKRALPAKTVAITFDDGYRDNLTAAAPILKKFNFTATIFLAIDYIRGEFKSERDYWEEWEFLNWAEIRTLVKLGFEIGSHSAQHRIDHRFDNNIMSTVIKESKLDLEEHIQNEVKLFSYPHGFINGRLKSIVKNTGFIGACSSFPGKNTPNTDLFELRRIEIASDDDIAGFQKKLKGFHGWKTPLQKGVLKFRSCFEKVRND